MADSMDLVQKRVQEELARNLATAIHRPIGASEFFCLSYGEETPEARRFALPGVELCVTKEVSELKSVNCKGAAL